jgi:hypothetical protein
MPDPSIDYATIAAKRRDEAMRDRWVETVVSIVEHAHGTFDYVRPGYTGLNYSCRHVIDGVQRTLHTRADIPSGKDPLRDFSAVGMFNLRIPGTMVSVLINEDIVTKQVMQFSVIDRSYDGLIRVMLRAFVPSKMSLTLLRKCEIDIHESWPKRYQEHVAENWGVRKQHVLVPRRTAINAEVIVPPVQL